MRTTIVSLTIVTLLGTATFGFVQNESKPKHEIKEVMQTAHKGGLLKTVAAGNASDSDKVKLLDLYISMAENKPPKGDAASWDAKTKALVLAAAKMVAGREDAADQLKAATNCMACHREHRPAP